MGYFPHNPRLSTRRAHDARMHAYVYKSQRKADTFVYLAARDDFGRVPEPLRTQLGALLGKVATHLSGGDGAAA